MASRKADTQRPKVPVQLYLDFGTAYIRVAVKLADEQFKQLEFSDQKEIPTYMFVRGHAKPGGSEFPDFFESQHNILHQNAVIGCKARELSKKTISYIVFQPSLLLRSRPSDHIRESLGAGKPFQVFYDAVDSSLLLLSTASPEEGVGAIDRESQYTHGLGTDAKGLNALFMQHLSVMCQQQDDMDFSIRECYIAAHDIERLRENLRSVVKDTVFQGAKFLDRSDTQIHGLLRQFPKMLASSRYIVIVRMGAQFSSVSIYSFHSTGYDKIYSFPLDYGGNEIDFLLMNYCAHRFQEMLDLDEKVQFDRDGVHRLRLECEAAKIALSHNNYATINVTNFHAGLDLNVQINHTDFYGLLHKLCYQVVNLLYSKISEGLALPARKKLKFDLILTGGTSKIPLIRELITKIIQEPNTELSSAADDLVLRGLDALHTEKETNMPQRSPSTPIHETVKSTASASLKSEDTASQSSILPAEILPNAADAQLLHLGSTCTYRVEYESELGHGSYGFVYLATIVSRGNYEGSDTVAVKKFRYGVPSRDDPQNLEVLAEKWNCLLSLKHERLVVYHKVSIKKTRTGTFVELLMDYYEKDLAALLSSFADAKETISLNDVVKFGKQIAEGVAYLHGRQVIHGDLKPGNILVRRAHDTNGYDLLIADLDDHIALMHSQTGTKDVTRMRGTARYMSPEMVGKFLVNADIKPGRKTDVWSLGCILMDLADCFYGNQGKWMVQGTNEPIRINNQNDNFIFYKTASGFVPLINDNIHPVIANIIKMCLQESSDERIAAASLVEELHKVTFDS
ncbi:uncharacterized protein LOC129600287 [Paramacrobiotus metropolitanus]|uniref:uncharacterized protein LOC129600287 n=1 Tax=Paramacrobiotus metropolitanus TaxID=2943436 RepID=UPI0024464AD8|nr:uncharacterized protein LOC129600287 [Paramacrobiotus metropolitanus]XP_055354741.1 uncharacterized protein LOC129600287 [Paramacrobiotus metropolitanus]